VKACRSAEPSKVPRACEKSALNARNEATSSLSTRTGASCGNDDADVVDALGWIFLGTSSAGLAVEDEEDDEDEAAIAVSCAAIMRSIAGASRCARKVVSAHSTKTQPRVYDKRQSTHQCI
jgi:hypothetical protein